MDVRGIYSSVALLQPGLTNFHHELAPGKAGTLGELDAVESGVPLAWSDLHLR